MYQVNTSNTVSSSTIELANKLNTGHFYSPHVSKDSMDTVGCRPTGDWGTRNAVIGSRRFTFVANHIGNIINKYEN